VRYDAVKVKH
jgi:hypothetical protein